MQTKVRSTLKDKHLGCIYFVGQLKGQVHGLAHVHESNYFFSDLLLILPVNNPTHMYLSDHIL